MTTKNIYQVDADTGEIIEGYVAVLQPKKRNGFINGWYAMSQDGTVALLSAMMAGKLHMRDVQVLYYLLSTLDLKNLIHISQVEAAKKLKMQRQNINRSMKKLVNMGVVEEGEKQGRARFYRLNPDYGWKGKSTDHQKALRQKMEQAGIKIIK